METILTCPLRWALQAHGGDDSGSLASVTGSLVHALVQADAEGAAERELEEALRRRVGLARRGAPWFSRRELGGCRAMLAAFVYWRDEPRRGFRGRGRAAGPARPGGGSGRQRTSRVRGRVDRLEIDAEGGR